MNSLCAIFRKLLKTATLVAALTLASRGTQLAQTWQGYAHDPQHTAQSSVPSQPLAQIIWQTPVDLHPQFQGDDLHVHYGSPLITTANTVIIPVKTGDTDGFELQARSGADGSLLWTQTTDYTLPPSSWTPSYGPTLTPQGRVYWAAAGGTLNYRSNVDVPGAVIPNQVNFYVSKKLKLTNSVQISTPLTSDANGTIFFGYDVNGTAKKKLGPSGVARIDSNGVGSFTTLEAGAKRRKVALQVVLNCAPAVSHDGQTIYIAAHAISSDVGSRRGYLVALDSTSLRVKATIALTDPRNGMPATLSDLGTASPTVGPDGKVFFGVLENPFTSDRGWLLQFDAALTQSTGVPASFGWDDTASIVPASLVPSYQGSSSYLLMTKYNNYVSLGGDGLNRLAILDPNDSQVDPRTGVTVMKEVISILGPTPDDEFEGFPGAVREWCINTAAVDPFTHSILANSEDGRLYRWDLATNTLSEAVTLTAGVGEAYTPTVVGADGKVYAINNATLFAVGAAP
jgi:hypothetical protein